MRTHHADSIVTQSLRCDQHSLFIQPFAASVADLGLDTVNKHFPNIL